MATIAQTMAGEYAEKGLKFQREGYPEAAESMYRRALDMHEGNELANYMLGTILMDKGDFPQATGYLGAAVSARPTEAIYRFNYGKALLLSRLVDKAIVQLAEAVRLDGSNLNAHLLLGNAYQDVGRYTDAVAAYRQLIVIEPDIPEAYNNLGNALSGIGDLDAAVAAFKKALSLRDDFADAYSNLGSAYLKLGKHKPALEAGLKAVKLAPASALNHYNLGNCYRVMGKLQQALDAYSMAISKNTSFAQAWNSKGAVLLELGKADEADECFAQAGKLDRRFANRTSA